MDLFAEVLRKRRLPHQVRRNSSSVYDPAHDSIKVMTLHVSKGLELPVVALVGAGRMPAKGEDERKETRSFDVGANSGDAANGDRGEWGQQIRSTPEKRKASFRSC
jgi:ATP-dependent exoDNAse (exonuclease V) beta subunit